MKKRDNTIKGIVTALAIYDDNAPKDSIQKAVEKLDPESIGVLHGITGVFIHASASKMPAKWLAQIHGDLMEAFGCLYDVCRMDNTLNN